VVELLLLVAGGKAPPITLRANKYRTPTITTTAPIAEAAIMPFLLSTQYMAFPRLFKRYLYRLYKKLHC
jgi:hypothetical protein